MRCSGSELFPGMLIAAHSGSYQATRTGLKLADPPQCLVLPGESLRLDLNSCKPHLTSVEFHSGILFRKNFESSVHPQLEKIPGDGKLFTHCSIKHLCLHQRYVNWKFDDYLCFAESVQAWSSWLKCFTITFESSLNLFCTVAVISLGISKYICISEEAGSTWLPWEERKGVVSGNFS